jgi:CRP/FNR family transcriptional regulator
MESIVAQPNLESMMAISLDPMQTVYHTTYVNDSVRIDGFSEEGYATTEIKHYSLRPFHAVDMPNTKQAYTPNSLWRESIATIQKYVDYGRRKVKADERIYLNGDPLKKVYLINTGLFKILNVTTDGREQPAGLFFKGDWLGFDGIPSGKYSCSAIALDAGEIWSIDYDRLLQLSAKEPIVLRLLMAAISAQLAQNRDVMLSMSKLPADSRVCDFLLQWAHCLEDRGLRTDQFNVYLTRADIGRYLGLRLESVSRALSKLAKQGLIEFNERGRREISIPNLDAMTAFIQSDTDRHGQFLQ